MGFRERHRFVDLISLPPRGSLQYLLQYVTPLDAWKRRFRLQEILSKAPMKPGISHDMAYNLGVMGFKGYKDSC
jgi:hypothetical protein